MRDIRIQITDPGKAIFEEYKATRSIFEGDERVKNGARLLREAAEFARKGNESDAKRVASQARGMIRSADSEHGYSRAATLLGQAEAWGFLRDERVTRAKKPKRKEPSKH